jgi:hypothetical protein
MYEGRITFGNPYTKRFACHFVSLLQLPMQARACKCSTFNSCRSLNTPDKYRNVRKGTRQNLQFLPGQWWIPKYVHTCQCLRNWMLWGIMQWDVRNNIREYNWPTYDGVWNCATTSTLRAMSSSMLHDLALFSGTEKLAKHSASHLPANDFWVPFGERLP